MKKLIIGLFATLAMSSCQTSQKMESDYLLTDVSKNINLDNWEINNQSTGLAADQPWSVKKYTLKGGQQEGVEIVEIDNGKMLIRVSPTKGMNVVDVKSKDITLGWDSPVKDIVHPRNVNLNYNGGLGWLDSFNDWMVRCGIEYSGHPGDDNGRLMTLHGRIAHIAASKISLSVDPLPPYTIKLTGVVNEAWFKGANFTLETSLSIVPGAETFRFDDTITNNSTQEKEFQILYHANFAKELLEQGSSMDGTIAKVQPFNEYAAKELDEFQNYKGPAEVWRDEQVYQITPFGDKDGMAHFILKNKNQDKAVSFKFNVDALPYFTQWKNEDSRANGYVTGLEPGNTFPANRSHERTKGRLPKIAAGESINYRLEYSLHNDKNKVAAAQKAIDLLKQGKELKLIKTAEH